MASRRAKFAGLIFGVLAVQHFAYGLFGMGPAAAVPLGWVANLGLLIAHLFYAYVGAFHVRGKRLPLYLLGYAAIFALLFFVRGGSEGALLLILSVLWFAALFHLPLPLGYLFIFLLAYTYLAAYTWPIILLGCLLYTGLIGLIQRRAGGFVAVMFAIGSLLFFATLLPTAHLTLQVAVQDLLAAAGESGVLAAIGRSLLTATITTAIILLFGVPLAYALVRTNFRGKAVVDCLVDVPILIPQPVVGLALLNLLGSSTTFGRWLEANGLAFEGTMAGVIAAQVLVSSPFLIRAAMTAFSGFDAKLENVARTLGASPWRSFCRVSLPLAKRGILFGCILTWARAISEYGALVLIAGSVPTGPIRIYEEYIVHGLAESQKIAVLMLLLCLWAFVAVRFFAATGAKGLFALKRRATVDQGA